MTATTLISAHNICHAYGNKNVLKDITLNIHRNEIITLIGPNGAGKSTLLKILLGLIKPTEGRVERKPSLRIGFMPQKIQIDASMPLSVERFLALGLPAKEAKAWSGAKLLKTNSNILTPSSSTSGANDTTHLAKIINELNLNDILHHPIQQASGGEMQRVLLARALLRSPELLVLDEPVQGVDLQGQTELYHYINHIKQTYGCGILMVSHDLHIVMKNTDKVLCLNQHICCSGHPQAVSENPAFLQLFGQEFEEIAIYEHHHDEHSCEHEHGHPPS